MRTYRSELEIVKDILTIISNKTDVRKTHIMYRANLSYQLLDKYLTKILNTRLAQADEDGFFRLTVDGRSYLEECVSYINANNKARKQSSTVESKRIALEELLDIDSKKQDKESVNINRSAREDKPSSIETRERARKTHIM